MPLILTKEVERSMLLLNKCRDSVGVSPSNQFLFAIPTSNSLKNIRGPDALRKHVKSCPGLECPDVVRSTNLRKHVATLSQVLNLENEDLEMLARFLGHDIAIHRVLPTSRGNIGTCKMLQTSTCHGEGSQPILGENFERY